MARRIRITAIKHAHIAAKGQCSNTEFRSPTIPPTSQRFAEAHAKAHDVQPRQTSDDELPSLVERHQDADGYEQKENVVQHIHRLAFDQPFRESFSRS